MRERSLRSEKLEHEHAQRPEVDRLVVAFGQHHLWGNIVRSTAELSSSSSRRRRSMRCHNISSGGVENKIVYLYIHAVVIIYYIATVFLTVFVFIPIGNRFAVPKSTIFRYPEPSITYKTQYFNNKNQ